MHVELEVVGIDALLGFGEHVDKILPNFHSLVLIKMGVLDGEVDTTLECLIKCSDAVGGENEDAIVVFKSPKEDYTI